MAHAGRALWRPWWMKALFALALLGVLAVVALAFAVSRDLPSVEGLRQYEPPLPTHVRAIDGTPIDSFARERRVELSYDELPPVLVRAYLAAEDRTFFEHGGVDYPGIASAILTNLRSDGRPVGASTITQQVAKNLLLTNEVSYARKAREALLAYRIEDALTKQQILELYLNQIFLGRNAYGVQAAARAYFGKDAADLSLAEAAYLAILPKGPANYNPQRYPERAVQRRNWVLGEMLRNNFVTEAQYRGAVQQPLGTTVYRGSGGDSEGGYFVEEVRRQLVDRFGEDAEDGPFSVYGGGLWVRTSYDRNLQDYAEDALRAGFLRYDQGKAWSGPVRQLEIAGDDWRSALVGAALSVGPDSWHPAVVIARDAGAAEIGFADGATAELTRGNAARAARGGGTAFSKLARGDVVAVEETAGGWTLRNVPSVSGGMVVQDPNTGRVLAMQGGWDQRLQSFNRATQALRQPGSTIKPFIYSAALDGGMTPATIINDATYCVYQSASLGQKCFRNFSGGGAGPHTMRWGIEQSRNLMTVRAAAKTGMPNVVRLLDRMKIGDYSPYLSIALGAGETTVLQLTNAYSMLVNHGRELNPSLIDYVQDRRGDVILPENWRPCDGCNAADWNGRAMPRPARTGRQLLDAMTAYQMVHILEGVVERGTAQVLRDMDRPLMGKTGTTNGPTDVWFVGGSPELIAGLYIGFDTPRNLGGYMQGGTFAAPIFKQFALKAMDGMDRVPFRAPAGIRMVRIDRGSGRKVYGSWPGLEPQAEPRAAVIWEAFKPESEGRRAPRRTAAASAAAPVARAARSSDDPQQQRRRDADFLQREGGIY